MTRKSGAELGTGLGDQVAAILKGAGTLLPWPGGLIAELASTIIPGQRQDRLATYVRELEQRLAVLERSFVASRLTDPEVIELIEEGADSAIRATSVERIGFVAALVTEGIGSDSSEAMRNARLLDLLRQIDDEQIAMLLGEAKFHLKDWREAPSVPVPAFTSSAQGWEARVPRVLFEQGYDHLVRLGLLDEELELGADGAPRLDSSSRDFARRRRISSLGLLLLRRMGFASRIED